MFLPPSLRLTHARPSVPLTRVPIPASAGCPDWQSGEKKDLKWRLICQGVEKLIEERGLNAVFNSEELAKVRLQLLHQKNQ